MCLFISLVILDDFAFGPGKNGRLHHSSLFALHFTEVPEMKGVETRDQCFASQKVALSMLDGATPWESWD